LAHLVTLEPDGPPQVSVAWVGLDGDEIVAAHGRAASPKAVRLSCFSASRTYTWVRLGPEVKFPPMDDPPPGDITRIAVERVGGVGPWAR
jgi:hypothetical protein